MATSTVMKNASINLPAEIRKNLNLLPGDRVSFMESDHGIVIVPLVDLFELVDASNLEKAKEIVKEIIEEREQMAKNDEDISVGYWCIVTLFCKSQTSYFLYERDTAEKSTRDYS